MSLKVEIRRHQFLNKEQQNVILSCSGQNVAEWVAGSVDGTWYDVTSDAEGLENFTLIVRQDGASEKSSESAASLQITFTGGASELINEWLFETPCSYINFFDVRVTDLICGEVYSGYELKPDNLETCDGDGCYFTLSLREGEDKYRELKKLSIHDNWQKWFSEDGNKSHPTFQVVIQQEPVATGMKGALLLFAIAVPVVGQIVKQVADLNETFKKMLGFGRYHAAPKVYDILLNACMKIGLTLNTPFDPSRELHNDCLFIPYGGAYHTNFKDKPEYRESPSTKHIWNNRYIWQVTDFLDELCKLYCMKWDIINGVLVVNFLEDIIQQDESYTISDAQSICYEFDLTKKPAYGRYEYSIDGGDSASNQVQILYNDIVDYDGVAQNPMLEGSVTKQVRFASTGFYCDSFGINYVNEAMDLMKMGALAVLGSLLIAAASLIAGIDNWIAAAALTLAVGLTATLIITEGNKIRNRYGCDTPFAGIIRIWGSGAVSVPRIIRWDPSTPMNNAKAVETLVPTIQVNPRYNIDSVPYASQFSGTGIYQDITRVWNYPLFFDSWYKNNLYETYHETVDNPLIVNMGFQLVTAEIPLCCDTIGAIGTSQEGDTIVGKIVKIKEGYFMYVTEATLSYEARMITLKGKIIRR